MTHNSYLEQELKKGKLNKQVQVKFKEDGTITVSPIIELETAKLRTEGEALGLDWGMVNLFTTSDGRRLGSKMLQKLQIYDKLLMEIQAELQRNNESLKTNPEYQRLQSKIRNFVKNEIGRIELETAKLRTEGEALGLDWGMVNLFTTSDGRRLGSKMLQKLQIYDKLLMEIQAELQRNNESLKTNPEYQRLQSKIRNFVKNEIGRILNNLAKEDLKELVVEKLNFAGGGMSRTLNRLLTRTGRKALQTKLTRLDEEQGVTTTEVQAAYTSQMCAHCGHTDKKNRQNQAKFKCQCCGYTCNADVNAAFNILQRRSLKISLSNHSEKRKTLKDRLLDAHSKMCPSGKHLSMISL